MTRPNNPRATPARTQDKAERVATYFDHIAPLAFVIADLTPA
jgi:hypothetical protein